MAKLPHAERARTTATAQIGAPAPGFAAVDELNQQAWEAQASDPRQALALAAQALSAVVGLHYPLGAARSHFILGACHAQLDEYEAARSELLAALELYEGLGECEPQSNALNVLGNVYSALGDHHAAYELYLRSLALRQALGLTKAQAASWNNIGNAYFHLKDYQQALEAHQRSLALKEGLGDQAGAAISLNNIGNVYKASDDPESALRYYRRSLAVAQAVGSKYAQAGALGNLGTLYGSLDDPQASLEYHLQSLAIEREIGNRHGEAESLLQLGRLFLLHPALQPLAAVGAPAAAAAQSYLGQAQAIAADLQAREILMNVAELMAQLYEQRGDLEQALASYRQFHALERALFNETLSEKTKKLQILHQVQKARQEAVLQRIEAELAHLKNTELQALLKEADRQRAIAEEASHFKTKLLSIAAHDLKTPLSGISGYADLLLIQLADDSPPHDIAKQIRESARRMEHMVDDLLSAARIDAGELHLQLEPIDLAQLVYQVAEVFQRRTQRKGQTLIVDVAEGHLVQADRSSMWRVLENLISNAIKYSPYERRIWVSLGRHEGGVRCAVRDEGPGLTADDHSRLFGRFERLSATPTGGESSTGLGLAIVRQLVELHGGRVWAESAGPGCGSTFTIELPALTPGA